MAQLVGWVIAHPLWSIGIVIIAPVVVATVFVAPFRLWRKENARVGELERERIPKFAVTPDGGRKLWDHHVNEYLMWAELKVKNTSLSQTLHNVEVRVVSYVWAEERHNKSGEYILLDFAGLKQSQVYWSRRDADPQRLAIDIPPGSERTSLVAYSDASNGPPGILNAPIHQALSNGGKIEIEVTSPDSAAWKGAFYIECHPNYVNSYRDASGVIHALLGSGTKATFEFVPWEEWVETHPVTLLSTPGTVDSETG